MTSRLLTADEVAERLGLYSPSGKPLGSWVLAEARARRIPHVKLGRYVRFEADMIEAWIATNRHGPTPAAGPGRRRVEPAA